MMEIESNIRPEYALWFFDCMEWFEQLTEEQQRAVLQGFEASMEQCYNG